MAKLIGWVFSMSFFISGLFFAQMMTDSGDIEPLILVIFSFGIVYWLSKTTYEASKKIMAYSICIMLLTAALAKYAVGDFINGYIGMGFYSAWEVCLLALGTPTMAYIFKHDA